MSLIRVVRRDIENGLWEYLAFDPNWVAPVGMAWVQGTSGDREVAIIYDCYVPVSMRRMGIMKAIVDEMFKHYDVITSDGVTKEGTGFMKHMGFKYRRETGDYYKERK